MQISSTKNVNTTGVNCLIYGQPGAGKTSLIKTLPEEGTLILDAEAGLRPLAGRDYAVVHISNLDDFKEAYNYIIDNQATIKNLVIDSISEIAELLLVDEQENNKDGRMAYSEMGKSIMMITRKLRDLKNINVFMLAKMERIQDDTGKLLFSPSLPGQKAAQKFPYDFDLVSVLRVDMVDGKPVRHLQTSGDGCFIAKDRSGLLSFAEEPDLGLIIQKMRG